MSNISYTQKPDMYRNQMLGKVQQILKLKKSKNHNAEKLGITLEEYEVLVKELKETKQDLTESHNYISDLEEVIVKVNNEKGTLESTVTTNFDPKSDKELIKLHKIDTSKYKLSSYWSKQRGEKFTSSVFCTIKKKEELEIIDIEEVIKSVFKEKIFQVINFPTFITNGKALFVYTSDKHVGAYTKPNAPFENKYDEVEFKFRLMQVYYEILQLVQIYQKFEDIFIIDLGDSVDGFNGYTTRGGHKLPQMMTNKETFNTYVEGHKEFFDQLLASESANNYHFIVQTEDNHSGDFGYITNQSVIIYLNNKYPQVKTKIFDKFLQHFEYGDHTFILTHGKDSEDLKHGLPLYINDKAENYVNKYINYHNIESKNIHLIKGDLHQDAFQDTYNFRYRNTLSLYGMSKWIANNFGPNKAGCSFDIVEKDSNRVFSHRMFF